MSDYNQLKNAAILTPAANTDLGSETNKYGNVFLSGNVNFNGTALNATNALAPKVTTITYPGDDTAADPAGGQTITLTGQQFNTGVTVLIGGAISAPTTSRISDTVMTFTTPPTAAGTYVLYVVNTDGSTAIVAPGISFSGTPNWSTPAGSLGTSAAGSSVSFTVAATGDAPISYAITSGTLPSGVILNSSTGVISGTAPALSSSTTYNFTIRATDAQNQDTNRAFSLFINTMPLATGGTIVTSGDYKIHTFTSSGTLTFSSGGDIEYLVVGGGGSGGTGYYGGGGGGGGFLTGNTTASSSSYTITVGAGGVGTTVQTNRGGNGGDSSISGTGISLTSIGGGGGGSRNNDASGGNANGAAGGSGGGACFPNSTGGAATSGQGFAGASCEAGQFAGGGGGAGEVGHNLPTYANRNGGNGLTSDITGSSVYYAGGGGGNYGANQNGLGGGSSNIGGGGRGGAGNNEQGESGGAGRVIVKYKFQ